MCSQLVLKKPLNRQSTHTQTGTIDKFCGLSTWLTKNAWLANHLIEENTLSHSLIWRNVASHACQQAELYHFNIQNSGMTANSIIRFVSKCLTFLILHQLEFSPVLSFIPNLLNYMLFLLLDSLLPAISLPVFASLIHIIETGVFSRLLQNRTTFLIFTNPSPTHSLTNNH